VVSFYAETQKAFAGTHLQISGVALTERGSWSVSTANGAQIVIGDREQAGAGCAFPRCLSAADRRSCRWLHLRRSSLHQRIRRALAASGRRQRWRLAPLMKTICLLKAAL
jgi:Cell division protein FtsQ.